MVGVSRRSRRVHTFLIGLAGALEEEWIAGRQQHGFSIGERARKSPNKGARLALAVKIATG